MEFKGNAKSFTRTYDFLASILSYTNPGWEKLSIFLNFLVPKLPAPKEEEEQFGKLFDDPNRVMRRIHDDIAPKVGADVAYQNAKKNTPNAAGIEFDAALKRVVGPLWKDDTEFYNQFMQNEAFRQFVTTAVARLTDE